jgi:uncharacterized membrane protein (UPF0136 family)
MEKKRDEEWRTERDADFMPPCLAAQQCAGVMFGMIVGYCALLLLAGRAGGLYLCCAVIACAVVFGVLGSRVSSPVLIRGDEYVKLCVLVMIISVLCVQLLEFDLLGVLLISLLDALVASAGMIFLRTPGPISQATYYKELVSAV